MEPIDGRYIASLLGLIVFFAGVWTVGLLLAKVIAFAWR
jgi:hypothetical protein